MAEKPTPRVFMNPAVSARSAVRPEELDRLLELAGSLGGRAAVLPLDPLVDLLAMDLDVERRFDAELDLAAAHFQDDDLDVVADADVLARPTSQHQHGSLPLRCECGSGSLLRRFVVLLAPHEMVDRVAPVREHHL